MRLKLLLNLPLLFIYVRSFSQIWCYPGATWHYTHYNSMASMYTKHEYVYDTIISTKLCNKITYYTQGYGTSGPIAYFSTPIFTHINGNVIYIKDQFTSNFDTLFNYGAVPGNTWLLAPKSVSTCISSKATVADTGHFYIQSQYLKWLKVNVNGVINFTDTIVERIGSLNRYFYFFGDVCPTAPDQDKGGPLRCYDDNQIIGYKRYSAPCNYFYSPTSIQLNNSSENKFTVYPNPTETAINIYVSEKLMDSEIEIINFIGQTIAVLPYTNHINISTLSEGSYFLKLSVKDSYPIYQKFVVKK